MTLLGPQFCSQLTSLPNQLAKIITRLSDVTSYETADVDILRTVVAGECMSV